MDLRVTVRAAAHKKKRAGTATARQSFRRVDDRGMARALVASLAQKRRPQLEQRRLRRAVRIMTVGAAFSDRLMFPQKRPAELGVTACARFVDRVFYQLRRRC